MNVSQGGNTNKGNQNIWFSKVIKMLNTFYIWQTSGFKSKSANPEMKLTGRFKRIRFHGISSLLNIQNEQKKKKQPVARIDQDDISKGSFINIKAC